MIGEQQFLCLCDLLASAETASTVSFTELFQWSHYVTEQPVRPLFAAGRLLFHTFDVMRDSVCPRPGGPSTSLAETLRAVAHHDTKMDKHWAVLCEQLRSQVLAQIRPATVAAYLAERRREEELVPLGEIIQLLGKHAAALQSNPLYAQLIIDYVTMLKC